MKINVVTLHKVVENNTTENALHNQIKTQSLAKGMCHFFFEWAVHLVADIDSIIMWYYYTIIHLVYIAIQWEPLRFKMICAFLALYCAMTEYDFLVVKFWLLPLCPCFQECFFLQWVTVVAYETGLGGAVWPVNYNTTAAHRIAIFFNPFPASLSNECGTKTLMITLVFLLYQRCIWNVC